MAREMDMVVLGTGDEAPRATSRRSPARFAGSRFNVKYFEVMDRAGYLQIGLSPRGPNRGCAAATTSARGRLQHLHITPHGQCVLCCEDYDENYVVGDLTQERREVLTGPEIARLRRWVYGLEEAPPTSCAATASSPAPTELSRSNRGRGLRRGRKWP